jgi:hypothetical protein
MPRYVTMQTKDDLSAKLHQQIEKLSMLLLWVWKASALLDQYLTTIDRLTPGTGKDLAGRLIQESESYIMASVTTFLRCFLDQPSTHLRIREVTTDNGLLACFQEISSLRNDGFVHWKGSRSELTVKYSYESIDPKTISFAETLEISCNEEIGPPQDTEALKSLYGATADHIENRRRELLEKLRKRFATTDALLMTQLLDEHGRSVIKRAE